MPTSSLGARRGPADRCAPRRARPPARRAPRATFPLPTQKPRCPVGLKLTPADRARAQRAYHVRRGAAPGRREGRRRGGGWVGFPRECFWVGFCALHPVWRDTGSATGDLLTPTSGTTAAATAAAAAAQDTLVARYGAESVVTRAYVPPSELAFAVARVAGAGAAGAAAAAAGTAAAAATEAAPADAPAAAEAAPAAAEAAPAAAEAAPAAAEGAPADASDAAVAAFAEADLRAAAVLAAVTTSEPPAADWGRMAPPGPARSQGCSRARCPVLIVNSLGSPSPAAPGVPTPRSRPGELDLRGGVRDGLQLSAQRHHGADRTDEPEGATGARGRAGGAARRGRGPGGQGARARRAQPCHSRGAARVRSLCARLRHANLPLLGPRSARPKAAPTPSRPQTPILPTAVRPPRLPVCHLRHENSGQPGLVQLGRRPGGDSDGGRPAARRRVAPQHLHERAHPVLGRHAGVRDAT
jgi:hypothetical protein